MAKSRNVPTVVTICRGPRTKALPLGAHISVLLKTNKFFALLMSEWKSEGKPSPLDQWLVDKGYAERCLQMTVTM